MYRHSARVTVDDCGQAGDGVWSASDSSITVQAVEDAVRDLVGDDGAANRPTEETCDTPSK